MMKKLILFIAGALFLMPPLIAQDRSYSALSISSDLLEGVDAVVRLDETHFEILSPGKGRITRKVVYTILNEKKRFLSRLSLSYDPSSKINYIRGRAFDSFGNEIEDLKRSDIEDESAISGFSIYEDNRVKSVELEQNSYPYTVEFEYQKTYLDGLTFYPSWYPLPSFKMSVQAAQFKISSYKDGLPRYLEENLPQGQKVKKGERSLEWELKNFRAPEPEPYASKLALPRVLVGPNDFEIDGYKGSLATWEDFGKWIADLNEGRDQVPPEVQAEVKKLVAGMDNPMDKIRAVYEYLQSKTRYVSVQLGIGGLQPFSAEYVAENGYGDCKALSNYTYSLLKMIGIPSHYTLVNAGARERDINPNFPSDQFNHIILCVPLPADTVWLECTSQTEAFGYLSDFTSDRYVLAITPQGGKLIRTPEYGKSENLLSRKADIHLDEKGNAKAEVYSEYHALQEGFRESLSERSPEEQKKRLYEALDIPNFTIENFSLQRHKQRIPYVEEKLSLSIPKYATLSGKRIFFQPNLMNHYSSTPKSLENRKTDMELGLAYVDVDTLVYHLPENISVEYKPEDVQLKSIFGSYEARFILKGRTLTYIRRVEMKSGVFPKEKYSEFVDFRGEKVKADKIKIVLKSST